MWLWLQNITGSLFLFCLPENVKNMLAAKVRWSDKGFLEDCSAQKGFVERCKIKGNGNSSYLLTWRFLSPTEIDSRSRLVQTIHYFRKLEAASNNWHKSISDLADKNRKKFP